MCQICQYIVRTCNKKLELFIHDSDSNFNVKLKNTRRTRSSFSIIIHTFRLQDYYNSIRKNVVVVVVVVVKRRVNVNSMHSRKRHSTSAANYKDLGLRVFLVRDVLNINDIN